MVYKTCLKKHNVLLSELQLKTMTMAFLLVVVGAKLTCR